jgi:hypothetical protein
MDFFQSRKLCQTVAIFLLPFPERSIALENDWLVHQKGWNWSQLPHANKVLLQGSTRILIYIDGFQSRNCAQAVAILPSSIFPTFNCTSKTTGWFTRAEIDQPAYANKVLLQGSTHSYIHWWTSFSRANCAQAVSYLLPYSRTFNCTSKTTGWFTKRAEIDPNLLHNKVLLQGSTHSYIHWWTSLIQTVLNRYYLPFFHFPERSIALVKRLAGSGAEIDRTCPANKVLLR